ncbi:MAG: hypothetical protein RQ862_03420 [Candidatus Caldarchaeales archaeon]|jgi:hypothetical protein|nr:hypothetical protein [Candidatus Caldarchaeales archaeon]
MFKLKFLWKPIRRLYIPILRAIGYKCRRSDKPYYLSVWASGNGLHEDPIFSIFWRRSFTEDFWSETHIFGVEIFGESEEYEVTVDDQKKLLEEISFYLDRMLVKLFMNAVTEKAPDKWFTTPNQPTTLYYRHGDFPITVTAHHKPDETPYLVLTGKSTPSFQRRLEVSAENAKIITEFLTKGDNIPKDFWAAFAMRMV